jgi:hypothetical protein
MDRKAMIERLIKDDIQVIKDAMQNKDVEYLDFILRDGIGYNKMSDQSLMDEFNNRTWEIDDEE